ncbi:MAG: DUF2089 domain-containing protein [Acidobacteriota bacterium]
MDSREQLTNCPRCDSRLLITKYTCRSCGTSIEGEFPGNVLNQLSDDDRLFALVFLQTEGNMKDVERVMGISYPTIKARLKKLNRSLGGHLIPSATKMDESPGKSKSFAAEERMKILDKLSNGEISAADAAAFLRGDKPAEKPDGDKS